MTYARTNTMISANLSPEAVAASVISKFKLREGLAAFNSSSPKHGRITLKKYKEAAVWSVVTAINEGSAAGIYNLLAMYNPEEGAILMQISQEVGAYYR